MPGVSLTVPANRRGAGGYRWCPPDEDRRMLSGPTLDDPPGCDRAVTAREPQRHLLRGAGNAHAPATGGAEARHAAGAISRTITTLQAAWPPHAVGRPSLPGCRLFGTACPIQTGHT